MWAEVPLVVSPSAAEQTQFVASLSGPIYQSKRVCKGRENLAFGGCSEQPGLRGCLHLSANMRHVCVRASWCSEATDTPARVAGSLNIERVRVAEGGDPGAGGGHGAMWPSFPSQFPSLGDPHELHHSRSDLAPVLRLPLERPCLAVFPLPKDVLHPPCRSRRARRSQSPCGYRACIPIA